MTETFDLVVIGAGPGGYVAAIRAAQLGMNVACVEKRETLGGTCLNVGCIPSKALLSSSEKYHEAKDGLDLHGIECGQVSLNLNKLMQRKTKIVDELTKGIAFLFKKNKISHFTGSAHIQDAHHIIVVDNNKKETKLQTKNILIATGSESLNVPGVEVDEVDIVSSTGALSFDKVPEKLLVIGGGYIGLELGSVWARLGAEVRVVEYLDRILPGMDGEMSKTMQRILQKQGLQFSLGQKVIAVHKDKKKKTIEVKVENVNQPNVTETYIVDKVLVSIGRKPYTEGLGLENVGIVCDERGRIPVNKYFATNVPNIYAIGDVIQGPMLAHKAEDEGMVCVEMMQGQNGHIDYNLIPGIVYTAPEAATVGKTEEQLKEAKIEYKIGKFPFQGNSRAKIYGHTDGFVKILTCAKTDLILGAHIIGPDAGTLIAEIVAVMEFSGAAEDIARTCHGHPTLSEAVREAALAATTGAIHV